MTLPAPPERVFPLLGPVREYEWIPTWSCELVFSRSGIAELDCVFRTRFPADGPEDTWVVSRYQPPRSIEFVRVNAWRSMRYAIGLEDGRDGTTRATWTQILTVLHPDGNRLVDEQTDEAFAARMVALEKLLNHYLTTGTRLGS